MHPRSNTTHFGKFIAILKRMWSQSSGSDTPITRTASESPILPRIDTGPSIKKLLLPDERSMSDMRLPPIESIDTTIHVPWLLVAAEERRKLSEDVVVESDAVSMASLVSCSTHTGRVDVQDRAGGANVAGYRLSTGESFMNSISSGGLHLWNGNTNGVDIRSGQSPPLPSVVRVPGNMPPKMPAQPLSEKQQNSVDLTLVSTFRRIRRLLVPGEDKLPLTQKAICIAPAQCAEVNAVSFLSVVASSLTSSYVADSGRINWRSKSTDESFPSLRVCPVS
ncbi:hypothetical protein M404DRAFT_998655 [Pisolithus tinctorius Marx 270]|uniref:Uncharacterized protein n=1 Tax=Pisolithus tinctorius Marx 270 TaxID=870435 RepID=A0A0C3P2H0_PISTI|nr:hypothetical protein M404DRAFT_998655 [Pisolithus tinctorius Marx 270]